MPLFPRFPQFGAQTYVTSYTYYPGQTVNVRVTSPDGASNVQKKFTVQDVQPYGAFPGPDSWGRMVPENACDRLTPDGQAGVDRLVLKGSDGQEKTLLVGNYTVENPDKQPAQQFLLGYTDNNFQPVSGETPDEIAQAIKTAPVEIQVSGVNDNQQTRQNWIDTLKAKGWLDPAREALEKERQGDFT